MRMHHRNPIAGALKAQLADAICASLGECSLEHAMVVLDLDAADVSRLRHRRLQQFSITRLLRVAARLGYDIEVRLAPRPRPQIIRPTAAATVTLLGRGVR